MTPEEILAEEAAGRQRAGFAALAAAVLTILGVILTTLGQPSASQFDDKIVTVVDAMGRTANGQPIPPGRISAFAVEVGKHPAVPILGAILYGVGSLAIFFAIAYLFRATRARRPGMPQIALILAAVGSVGFGIGRAVSEIARYLGAHSFVSAADKTNSAASDALSPTRPSSVSSSGRPPRWRSASASRSSRSTPCASGCSPASWACWASSSASPSRRSCHRPAGHHPRLLAGRPRDALPGPAAERHTQGVGDRPSRAVADPAAAARAARGGAGRGRRGRRASVGAPAPSRRSAPAAPPPKAPSPRRPDPAAPGSEHSASKKKKRKRRS